MDNWTTLADKMITMFGKTIHMILMVDLIIILIILLIIGVIAIKAIISKLFKP